MDEQPEQTYVYVNGVSKVFHASAECPVARRTRYLQRTRGDGSNVLNGQPCKRCYPDAGEAQ